MGKRRGGSHPEAARRAGARQVPAAPPPAVQAQPAPAPAPLDLPAVVAELERLDRKRAELLARRDELVVELVERGHSLRAIARDAHVSHVALAKRLGTR